MLPTRRETWRWLALAVGLVALAMAALACAPIAAAGQGRDATTTPTATATATVEPTAITAPIPVVTPDKLDPIANALIALNTAPTTAPSQAEGAQDSPAPPALLIPEKVGVSISTLSLENTRRLLEANNGSIDDAETIVFDHNWVTIAYMPVSLLPALSRHPDTLYAFVIGPYPNLPGHLNRMVVEYAVRQLNPGDSVAPEPEPLDVLVQVTEEGYVNVRRFLQSHGVRLSYSDEELLTPTSPDHPRPRFDIGGFPQWIPVRLLGAVSQLPGVIYIQEGPKPILHEPLSRVNRQSVSTTTAIARSHGADTWHAAGVTGWSGVTSVRGDIRKAMGRC